MRTRIGPYREELRERFGVEAFYLFGSSARGEAGEESGVDFLVRFSARPVSWAIWA
ncbi:MAG: nucleotidyltransferase family protein [Thermus sp.]|uniref:nucleotidyltransferase family protein n=1 Tax=Thermus sp. TaxID=275 RepID=UPI00391C4E31